MKSLKSSRCWFVTENIGNKVLIPKHSLTVLDLEIRAFKLPHVILIVLCVCKQNG